MKNLLKKLEIKSWLRPGARGVSDICSEETFKYLLKRERARADRGHGIFSMVVFELQDGRKKLSSRRLIEVLKARVRITDSVGWLSDASIGALLADAPNEGGRAFLKDVLRSIPDIQPAPECHVYTYPVRSDGKDGNAIFAAQEEREDAAHAGTVFNEMLALNPSLGRQFTERVLTGFVLLLLSPLLLLIVVAIKLASPGPALYSQWRVGHKGTAFRCFKFRTMHMNADTGVHENYFKTLIATDVPMRKLDAKEDPRIFRLGRLLRSSSLDELPQLFNVLKGEMSLVGPRPPIPGEYQSYLPWHCHRIDVLPGLTGLWQVSGKNKTTFTEMMRFDMRYARQKSFRQDILIILKTVPVVIAQFMEDHRFGRLSPSVLFNERKKIFSRGKPAAPAMEDE